MNNAEADNKKKKNKKGSQPGPKNLESQIDVNKMAEKKDESTRIDGPADEHNSGIKWQSEKFQLSADGSSEEMNAKYNEHFECECQEIRNKFLIFVMKIFFVLYDYRKFINQH